MFFCYYVFSNYFFSFINITVTAPINKNAPDNTIIQIASSPNTCFNTKPLNNALIICGIVIKKLNIPIYTPVLPAGNAGANIAYGIASIEAQAIPIPIIGNINIWSLVMKYIEIKLKPPITKAIACVVLRPNFFEIGIKHNANNIATKLYTPNITPTQSPAC